MLKKFTIAHSITLTAFVLTLCITTAATFYLFKKEFDNTKNGIIKDTKALSQSRPHEIQLALRYQNHEVLSDIVADFFDQPEIKYVAIYNNLGGLLVERYRDELGDYPALTLKQSRQDVPKTESGVVTHASPITENKFLDVTVPILSVLSPLAENIERRQFVEKLMNAHAARSLHVAGYFQIGISQSDIQYAALSYARTAGLIGAVFVTLTTLFVYLSTRRLTAPLSRLARVAEDVAAGNIDVNFRVEGSDEVQQIGTMLNIVIEDLAAHKTKIDVDNVLLGMKTAELSTRNKELNQAVEEVTQAKNRLRKLAYYDALTSLPNRRLFIEQFNLLLRIAAREKHKVALLFIDIDNFKRINDSLGHGVGDLILQEAADRLIKCVRNSDAVARQIDMDYTIDVSRLGGDEFTVVLNKISSPEDAAAVAERLITALAAPVTVQQHDLVITPSIGIATYPADGEDVDGLLKHADTAMYHAKTAGKNTYEFYVSTMAETGLERLKLETDLRRGIERQELVLHYQPQVDIKNGAIVGAEAVVRWSHPELGIIPPMEFIPLAEEMGLIIDLGEWVLFEACRQMKAFQKQGFTLPKIAVNVSSLQFNQAFIRRVKQALAETRLDPQSLELELTEGMIMSNASASVKVLHDLKSLGVGLSVDDFGTGYSSLAYLSRFPLDGLKVDRSFIVDLDKGKNHQSLVAAIIAMGKGLELELIAEGVETAEQLNFLKKHGLRVIQGYLLSKPVAAQDFATLLTNNNFRETIKSINQDTPRKQAKVAAG